ncbi:acetylcholinesterase-1-like [Aplysia californica]|uniref:Carboxylic ester hydrolase n=1 Tax=Aplysia californica TaxID=6500 RepID=A0ABM1A2I2_APLCA|nr:acetylcholinesterase-1-like [Aplysia californica]
MDRCSSFILILAMLEIPCIVSATDVVIRSSFGILEGRKLSPVNGKTYVGFRGIPYAKPPIGELRFAKPEPHPKLEGQFNAKEEAVPCIRPLSHLYGTPPGREDCLLLNIFMQNLPLDPMNHRRKVLVFIHGGGYSVGASREYDPGTLITTDDIIVVTLNYRLGILGFMSTEDEASPGNFGLWDQALALNWVKTHIASFGGDPDDVTVAGESAGGISIQLLAISPFGKGLFTKMFSLSGGAAFITQENMAPLKDALELADHFGCRRKDLPTTSSVSESKGILKCLRDVPEEEFARYNFVGIDRIRFSPRIDGVFIPLVPKRLLKDETFLKSVGFFDRSYLVLLDNNERSQMKAYIQRTKTAIYRNYTASETEKAVDFSSMVSIARDTYITSRINLLNKQTCLEKVLDWYERRETFDNAATSIMADVLFLFPSIDFLEAVGLRKSSSGRFILFDHFPSILRGYPNKGMVHGMDIPYLFDYNMTYLGKLTGLSLPEGLNDEELLMKTSFISLVVDFVKTG